MPKKFRLAFSFLCENPQHQTALTTFFREYLLHSLNHFDDLEWLVFAGPNQEIGIEHPRLRYLRDYPANDRMNARLLADHFQVGPVARRLGAAGLFTIGFVPLRAPLPVFMGVNALLHADKENCPGVLRRRYRTWNITHGMRKASLVITNSAFTASRLREAYPVCAGKLIVSHEGTLPEFTPHREPGETEALEKALQARPGYLLWVSNFHHYKQAPLFLEGYADLPAEIRARMPVIMVGGDWGATSVVNELIKARNLESQVRVLGWVDAKWLAPLYRHALAYVLPSREETFGRTITEALSCGTPCVLNDIPTAHEISGDHALIIDFNNRALVTATLRRLLEEPALSERIRIEGLAQAKKFSFERMAVERVGAVREWLNKNAGYLPDRQWVAQIKEPPMATPPRRILHVNNSADIYGASRMLLRWIKSMDRTRFEPLVVLPEEGPLKKLIEAEKVQVILHSRLSICTRPVFYSWRIILFLLNYPVSVFFLWRLIRQRRIDLVYTNTGVIVSPALAARLAGVPHIWHIREWFQEFEQIWRAFSWYIRTFSRKIIAISNAVAGQFEPRDKVVVVFDAFSMEACPTLSGDLRHEFRARHALGEDFVVGCVGRIKFVRKGQEVLVKATAMLKQRDRLVKALIVGAPFPANEEHLTRLKKMVKELGVENQFVFTGELADPRPAYMAMDVLAMTSIQPEPFGGVTNEAMSLGLPVIATNIGGSLDQVVDGLTGLLVAPGDPAALADAIEKLMSHPELRRQMGAAAVERVRNYFSPEGMVGKIEQVLSEALGEPKT